ncbi:hypothetical protein MMC26_003972 [Xylographa opegraphella]|nr:hypothetical protein [Xylographa opegraphella]
MHSFVTASVLLSLVFPSCASRLKKRQDCGGSDSQCSPAGASSTTVPNLGPGLSTLYVDLLHSINGISAASRRSASEELNVLGRRSGSLNFCCANGTDCLVLQGFAIPFCYDRFTTNFFLPDGSYGTIDSGSYTTSDGSNANLLTGQHTLPNGTTDNIYGSANSPEVPNTSTLTLPTPFTSSGVGSAIPASELGGLATYTVTVPASTVQPTTLPPEIISPVVLGSTTIPTATTDPATTIPGTTIPPTTFTVTTHVAATASSTGGAGGIVSAAGMNAGAAGALGFLFVLLGI